MILSYFEAPFLVLVVVNRRKPAFLIVFNQDSKWWEIWYIYIYNYTIWEVEPLKFRGHPWCLGTLRLPHICRDLEHCGFWSLGAGVASSKELKAKVTQRRTVGMFASNCGCQAHQGTRDVCRDRLDQEKQDNPEPLPYLKEQPLGNLGLGQASSQVMAVHLFAGSVGTVPVWTLLRSNVVGGRFGFKEHFAIFCRLLCSLKLSWLRT